MKINGLSLLVNIQLLINLLISGIAEGTFIWRENRRAVRVVVELENFDGRFY